MKTHSKVDQGGETMDPEKIMNGISKEIFTALKAMEKAKNARREVDVQ